MWCVKSIRAVTALALLLVGMVADLHAEQGLEVVLPIGHERISDVSLSADGTLLATCGDEFSAKLWDVKTGTKLRDFIGHRNSVFAISLSSDGKQLLTCSYDETASIWNVTTGERRLTIPLTKPVRRGQFSRDGSSFLLVGSFEGEPSILRNSETGKDFWRTSVFKNPVISEDGLSIVEGELIEDLHAREVVSKSVYLRMDTRGGRLKDRATQKVLTTFEPYIDHRDNFENFTVRKRVPASHYGDMTPDGKTVVTAARGTMFVWDTATQARRLTIQPPAAPVVGLDLWGRLLGVGTSDLHERAMLFDLSTGAMIRSVPGTDLVITQNGEAVVTRTQDWNDDDFRAVSPLPQSFLTQWQISSGAAIDKQPYGIATRVKFVRDEKLLFASSSTIYDPGTRSVSKLKGQFQFYPGRVNESFHTISNNGKWALSVERESGEAIVVLWDLSTRREVNRTKLKLDIGNPLEGSPAEALSPDGKTILTAHKDFPLGEVGSRGRTGRDPALGNYDPGTYVAVSDVRSGRLLWEKKGHAFGEVTFAEYNADGRRFMTGGQDGSVVLWETQSGRQLQAFRGHEASITRIVFNKDESQLWTASADGTTRLWDVASGKELCKLMTFKESDWLVVTPEGLFDGSVDGPRYLAYRIPGTLEFVPLERYQQKFYQPGLLASLTRGTRLTPKVDITKSIPPKVRITSPALAAELKQSTIDVRVEAETRGEYPIKSLRLLLDGRPFGGQNGIHKIAEPKLGLVSAAWNIELDPGRHTLKVLADTEYVQGASEELEVRYVGGDTGTPSDLASVELPSLYVLSIGISKYPGTRRLDYAAADADAIAKSFDQYSRGLFKNLEVKAILDEQADRKGFFSGMQWLREKMTQKSVGVVFFAGHGEKDKDGTLYFLPVDFEENNLAGSAIDADVLKRQLMGVPGRLTLMLDACHSGEIGKGKTRGAGGLTDQLIRDLTAEENGLVMMCSALGNELAQESNEHRHGLFTVALLEGLKGQAEKTKDGAVYLTSLDAYVTKRVRELSKGQQNPVTGKPTSVRDFPMSRP